MADPIYRRFKEQRAAARQRGIEWKFEYWEWLQIWQDSGHLHERGTGRGQWVMARHGDRGAYEASNVSIVLAQTNNSEAARGRVNRRRETQSADTAA